MTETFTFGKQSERELATCREDLVAVVRRALEFSPVDFSVYDGGRDLETQQQYVKNGVSKTLDSAHLITDKRPKSEAVDLVPFIGGKNRWEWQPLYQIATAMRDACIELDCDLRWGGCWDVKLIDIIDPEKASMLYVERRRLMAKRVFLDGPHYEFWLRK